MIKYRHFFFPEEGRIIWQAAISITSYSLSFLSDHHGIWLSLSGFTNPDRKVEDRSQKERKRKQNRKNTKMQYSHCLFDHK